MVFLTSPFTQHISYQRSGGKKIKLDYIWILKNNERKHAITLNTRTTCVLLMKGVPFNGAIGALYYYYYYFKFKNGHNEDLLWHHRQVSCCCFGYYGLEWEVQTGSPLLNLFFLVFVLSGRLANCTLSTVNFQLLLKWEALVTLSLCFPGQSAEEPLVDKTVILQFLVVSVVLHAA